MSNIGKYLNLHPHVTEVTLYRVGTIPYPGTVIAKVSPKDFNGLSYEIISDKTGASDIYTILSTTYGKVDIRVTSGTFSITTEGLYLFNGVSGNSCVGQYLNLHPHVNGWNLYPTNKAPISGNEIVKVSPKQMNGLSYLILSDSTPYPDVYTIQSSTYGRVNIYAPRDNDSSISTNGIYLYTTPNSSSGSETGLYLNLHPHVNGWNLYPTNKASVIGNEIAKVSPKQMNGLSYPIISDSTGYPDVYTIQSQTYGIVNIYAPRDNDSSISSDGIYLYTTPNSSSGTNLYLNLHPHVNGWNLYPTNKAPVIGNEIAKVSPKQMNGLSYPIISNNTGYTDVYTIRSQTYGVVNIYAPRDEDSSIGSVGIYLYTIPVGSSSGNVDYSDIGSGNSTCRIYKRSEWGANQVILSGMSGVRTQSFKHIVIHHSADTQINSDMDHMKGIQSTHQSMDYGDIGYHYGIGKNGTVMQGRETKYVGAHTLGDRNRDGIGICLFGNFENIAPSQAQINNLIPLIVLLCNQYGLNESSISGHRNHTPTACPGLNLYNLIPQIKQKVKEKLASSEPSDKPNYRPSNHELLTDKSFLSLLNDLPFIKDIGVEFDPKQRLDDKLKDNKIYAKLTNEKMLYIGPTTVITGQCEASFKSTIGDGAVQVYNVSSSEAETKFNSSLGNTSIKCDLDATEIQNIFNSLEISLPLNQFISLKAEIKNLVSLQVTCEFKYPIKSDKYENLGTLEPYFNIIVTLHNIFQKGTPPTIPVPMVQTINGSNNPYLVVGFMLLLTAAFFAPIIIPAATAVGATTTAGAVVIDISKRIIDYSTKRPAA